MGLATADFRRHREWFGRRLASDGSAGGAEAQVATPTPPSDVEIRSLLKAVTNAYNQADAKELAARFTDDAVLFDQDGEEVQGRDAIGRHYAEAFAKGPTCQISGKVEE